MSNGYVRDPKTGKYRLVVRHGQPGVILRDQPLRTWERIQAEDRCPGCQHVYRDCHCAPPLAPDQLGKVLKVQRQRQGQAPATPTGTPPPLPARVTTAPPRTLRTFQNEAHRLLACKTCGYVSCRCGVVRLTDTLGQIVTEQQRTGRR